MSFVTDLPKSAKLLYQPKATISGDQSGWGAELGWVCDYADQDAFLETVAGKLELVGKGITRLVPLRHPFYYNMLAVAAKAEGFGHDSSKPASPWGYNYLNSRILVTFKYMPFPIVGDQPFMTLRLSHGNEAITIPGTGYQFPSTSQLIQGIDASVTVATTAYNLTLYQCPQLGDGLITYMQSTLNSTPIFGQPAGQMRFDGGDTDIVQTITGQVTYTRSLQWMYRTVSWNAILNPAGAWEIPTKTSDGTPMYASQDHNQLFQ